MTVNSKCYIPNDTPADDIVKAIAFLCGASREKLELGGRYFFAGYDINQVSVNPNSDSIGKLVYIGRTYQMQYHLILIAPTNCDNESHQGSLFIYPSSEYPGYILLHAGTSEFWAKIDRALVDLFGGYIDDNDCDESNIDYCRTKPRDCNCPNDGAEWNELQQALLDLPVLFEFIE